MQLKYIFATIILLGFSLQIHAQGSLKSLADRVDIHAYGQLVYSAQETDGKWSNGFDLRRLYMIANARFTDRLSMTLHYDFKIIHELYAVYKLKNNGSLNIKVGQYKSPLTYENSISPFTIENIAVGTLPIRHLVGGDALFGLNFGRDMGIMLTGDVLENKLHYELSIQNGCGINKRDNNNYKDVVARVDYKPSANWMFSLSGQKGQGVAVAKAVYNPSIEVGQEYQRDRLAVGAKYQKNGAILRSEFLLGWDGPAKSHGWVFAATLPISPKVELITIYDYVNKNTELKYYESDLMAGIQYKFHPHCRLQLEFTHTMPNSTYEKQVNLLQTQLQLGF